MSSDRTFHVSKFMVEIVSDTELGFTAYDLEVALAGLQKPGSVVMSWSEGSFQTNGWQAVKILMNHKKDPGELGLDGDGNDSGG